MVRSNAPTDKGFVLVPPNRLGDTILLEPILRVMLTHGAEKGYRVAVCSDYRDVFAYQHWPSVDPVEVPQGRFLNLTGPFADGNRVMQYLQLLIAEGIWVDCVTTLPRIDNVVPELCEGKKQRIGIFYQAKEERKRWVYWKVLAEFLEKKYEVHAFAVGESLGAGIDHTDLSTTGLMAWVASMDMVIANDTGGAHLAASMGIPTVVVQGPTDCKKLYEPYGEIVTVVPSPNGLLETLSAAKVARTLLRLLRCSHRDLQEPGSVRRRVVCSKKPKRLCGLMKLEGLGGTISLLDHAAKVYHLTGHQVELVTRGYESILSSHPAVCSVRNLGYADMFEAARLLSGQYRTFADIRIGTGRWYGRSLGKADKRFDIYYDGFPNYMGELEHYGLHHIQLANRHLGLAYDVIEPKICSDSMAVASELPDTYIVVAPGVDQWHRGLEQTKQWGGWGELIDGCHVPVVQVGTAHDKLLFGDDTRVIDLRRKTSLLELVGVLKKAAAVVCIEGGVMHLAYASGQLNTIVLSGPTKGKMFEYPGMRYINSMSCGPCWSQCETWAWQCRLGLDNMCMRTICPDRVLYQLQEVLNGLMVSQVAEESVLMERSSGCNRGGKRESRTQRGSDLGRASQDTSYDAEVSLEAGGDMVGAPKSLAMECG